VTNEGEKQAGSGGGTRKSNPGAGQTKVSDANEVSLEAELIEPEPDTVVDDDEYGWDEVTVPKRTPAPGGPKGPPPRKPPPQKPASTTVSSTAGPRSKPSRPPPPRPSAPPPPLPKPSSPPPPLPPPATQKQSPAEAMSKMRTAVMAAIPKAPPVPVVSHVPATTPSPSKVGPLPPTKVSALHSAPTTTPSPSPVAASSTVLTTPRPAPTAKTPPPTTVVVNAPLEARPSPAPPPVQSAPPAIERPTRGGSGPNLNTQPLATSPRPPATLPGGVGLGRGSSPQIGGPPGVPGAPPVPEATRASHPDTVQMSTDRSSAVALELRSRADRLGPLDPVAAARVFIELALLELHERRDGAAARKSLELALARSPGTRGAVSRLRRQLDQKKDLGEALGLTDQELANAATDAERAAVLVEHARLALQAGKAKEARVSFLNALRHSPAAAAALFGLDTTLRLELRASSDSALLRDLATHLERVTEVLAPADGVGAGESPRDPEVAAFVSLERAHLLETRLGQVDQAETSLRRAVSLVPKPGPARDTLRRHLAARGAFASLAAESVAEANVEEDDDRAARLFYLAARITADKLGQPTGATELLIAAARRAPAKGVTARRTLDELLRLLVATGKPEAAVDVRRRRMEYLRDNDAIRHEHLRLADLLDGIGLPDEAVKHAREALTLRPDDDTVRERLDALLEKLGRNEERVILWRTKGETGDSPKAQVAGYLRAAEMAESLLERPEDALVYLRAAFDLAPEAQEPLDRLSALVTPMVQDTDARRSIRTRIELCNAAARATKDVSRQVALHERMATLWEEAGEPARAVRCHQKALELEPGRRTSLLGIQRTAGRAGDHQALADALTTEAGLTADPALARSLLLRAARLFDGPLADTAMAVRLVDRAAAIDGSDPEVLRARIRLGEKVGRLDDVRLARLSLATLEPEASAAFDQWTAIALLDEHRRKRSDDAVLAYREAAKKKPGHVLPEEEITRLLRAAGSHETLAENLTTLAAASSQPEARARLYFQAAEIHELCLGNDEAALRALLQAETALGKRSLDEAIFEAEERLLLRKAARPGDNAARAELVGLYHRWIEAEPPAPTLHRLRLALAAALPLADARRAEEALRAAVEAAPGDVFALSSLAHLQRNAANFPGLATTLTALARACKGPAARCAVLWEMVRLEETTGGEATFQALSQLVADDSEDPATVDAVLRVGSKLLLAPDTAPQVGVLVVGAIRKRREQRWDAVEKALLFVEEGLVLERLAGENKDALAAYRQALELHPQSLVAARAMERLSSLHQDRGGEALAHAALAKIVEGKPIRAMHLTHAAALVESLDLEAALLHLEDALREHADCRPAAEGLARLLFAVPDRLIEAFAGAQTAATTTEQRRFLGLAVGEAALRRATRTGAAPTEVGPGITAVQRVVEQAPGDVEALWLLGRLYTAAALPAEADEALGRCIACPDADSTRLAACFALATLRESTLHKPEAAEQALAAALTIDPCDVNALLRYQRLAKMRGDLALADQLLARLVILTEDNKVRVARALDLASIRTALSDEAGAIAALVDAIVSLPDGTEAWESLASRFRSDRVEGATAYVEAIAQVLRAADSRAVEARPRWLITAGVLLANFRIDPTKGIELLRRAAAMPRGGADAAIALGRALDGLGSSAEAARVVRQAITHDDSFRRLGAPLGHALTVLESALAKEGRLDERVAVEEARACLGDASRGHLHALLARPFPHDGLPPLSLASREILRFFPESNSHLLAVANVVAPTLHKAIRTDVLAFGMSPREKLGSRDIHPIRSLVDKLARAFAVEPVDIYLSSSAHAAVVVSGEPHALIVPLPLLECPELEQVAALAMAMSKLSVGGALFAELPLDVLDAVLLGSLLEGGHAVSERELSPGRRQQLEAYLPLVKKAIGRKQRQRLETIEPPHGPPPDIGSLALSLHTYSHIVGCLASGSLAATLGHLARADRELGASLGTTAAWVERASYGNLMAFHLSPDAAAERARLHSATHAPPTG
jgi:cellulose synthase operon protein C